MSVLANDAATWHGPDQRLAKELRPEERTQMLAVKTMDMLRSKLDLLSRHREALRRESTWNRLCKVIHLLKPVAQAAAIRAQGICLPSNTLWGVLALVIDVGLGRPPPILLY